MPGNREQAIAFARKLLRTFASAPDARRRAQEVLSELRRCDDWSSLEFSELHATAEWLRSAPPTPALEIRLRQVVAQLSRGSSTPAC